MSKEITIKFIGSLGNRAGVIDGTVETGSQHCNEKVYGFVYKEII